MKNSVLHCYPSLTVQEANIIRENEDGRNGGSQFVPQYVALVWLNQCMWWYLVTTTCSKLATIFILHPRDSDFTMGKCEVPPSFSAAAMKMMSSCILAAI